MNSSRQNMSGMDEAQIAELLQKIGARPQPDAAAMARARAEVHGAWRESVAQTASRRQQWRYLAAAASVVLALAVALVLPGDPDREMTRKLAQSVVDGGTLEYQAAAAASGDTWMPVHERTMLAPGDTVRSAADGYGALALADGARLRLDRGTQLDLQAPGEIFLHRGAIYVEAPGASTLAVHTARGVARDIGTRFEVRLVDDGWRVQVREGRVVVNDRNTGSAVADAGESLLARDDGFAREIVSSTDSSWQWTHSAMPPMAIEGATLRAYLDWWSKESGLAVRFERPIDSTIAGQTQLHGSLDGLTIEQGFSAVTAGAGYRVVDRTAQQVMLTR